MPSYRGWTGIKALHHVETSSKSSIGSGLGNICSFEILQGLVHEERLSIIPSSQSNWGSNGLDWGIIYYLYMPFAI